MVPGSALNEVEKICSGEEKVTIIQGARHILFQTGDILLVCRRLEGEFLPYKNAIPRNNTIQVEVEAKALLSSIDRVSLIISEKLKSPLRCLFWGWGGRYYDKDRPGGHRRPVPHLRQRRRSGDWI